MLIHTKSLIKDGRQMKPSLLVKLMITNLDMNINLSKDLDKLVQITL